MDVITVYFLVSFWGGRVYTPGIYLTKSACKQGAVEFVERANFHNRLMCQEGLLKVELPVPGVPVKPLDSLRWSIAKDGSTCYGTDAFCGRN